MIWIIVAICAVISAISYRMGGSGNYPRQIRQFICPLATLLPCIFMTGWAWDWRYIVAYLLSYGVMTGFITTYWDFINKWFGKDESEYWWNWLLAGLFMGLACLFFLFLPVHFGLLVCLRAVVLAIAWTVWSELNGNAVIEECGRGALLVLTTLIFLI